MVVRNQKCSDDISASKAVLIDHFRQNSDIRIKCLLKGIVIRDPSEETPAALSALHPSKTCSVVLKHHIRKMSSSVT